MKRFDPEKFVKNKYNHLLSALILLFVFSPVFEGRDPHERFPVLAFIILVVLVAALRAGFPKGVFLYSFLGIAILSFVLNFLAYFLPLSQMDLSNVLIFISRSINVCFYIATVYLLARRLFRTRKVTADTIKGGVSAFLLIGFVWATLYSLLGQIDADAYTVAGDKEMMYMYFSFTTLTTLGYGDIIPHTRIAAILTSTEAIVGQLFLTIFVARLVGLYIIADSTHDRN